MIVVRSVVFALLFYLWSAVIALVMTPFLLAPRPRMIGMMKLWARGVVVLLSGVCGVRTEFRGRQYLTPGAALIAAKHQCMFDTMAPLLVLEDSCYVTKKELMWIPFYGWLVAKAQMLVVDREAQAKALRKLLSDARGVIEEHRQLVIFPEGTRTDPGRPGDYKPGIAGLYRTLGLPCTPMATNSGVHWPAHGFLRRPGTIVYEFLEPIPPGLSRETFMVELESRIEAASERLLAQ